jgi:hypothetical protein
MLKAVVTPFNAFSLFSFVLLSGIAILVHASGLPRFDLAAFSAACGFLLIFTFLVWTLTEGD